MPVSMNQRGCPSALPFLRCKVYSGQEFFELRGQLVARVGSRVVKRHLCRDQHSIHQPHLILAKGLVLIGGPPQGRYEQSDDRNLDRKDSESFQGGFSRSRHRSHTPLIWRRSCRTPVFFPDFWWCGHCERTGECLLPGKKWKSHGHVATSANDPKRTLSSWRVV